MKFSGDYDEALDIMKNKIKPLVCDDGGESFVNYFKNLCISIDRGQETLHGQPLDSEFSIYHCYKELNQACYRIIFLYSDLIEYSNTLYQNFLYKKDMDAENASLADIIGRQHGFANTAYFEKNPTMDKLLNTTNAREYSQFVIDLEAVPSAIDYVEDYNNYGKKTKEVYTTVKNYYTSILNDVGKWSLKDDLINTLNSMEYYADKVVEDVDKIVFIVKKTIEDLCNNDAKFKKNVEDVTRRISKIETPFDGLSMYFVPNVSAKYGAD